MIIVLGTRARKPLSQLLQENRLLWSILLMAISHDNTEAAQHISYKDLFHRHRSSFCAGGAVPNALFLLYPDLQPAVEELDIKNTELDYISR